MKIAILYPDDFSIWQFRKGLIEGLIKNNHEVYIICPRGPFIDRLNNIGCKHIHIDFGRFLSPVDDIKYIFRLYRIFRKHKFDIVHNFTIKPNLYGAISAKLAKVPLILGTVEGMGAIYTENSKTLYKLLRPIVSMFYRLSCKISDRYWFLNIDDLSFFVEKKLIAKEKAILVKSTGLNTEEYSEDMVDSNKMEQLKIDINYKKGDKLVVMIVARFLWSKGIREFLEASKIVTKEKSNIRFILVGTFEEGSPDIVPKKYITDQQSDNFTLLEFRNDIVELLSLSELVTLPSFYREGVPRILMEAMALKRPIITTDNVGCRELVEEGKNGYLVPIKNEKELAKRILDVIIDEEKSKAFGEYGRQKVVKEFDDKIIVSLLLKELYRI
ncbi:MAG: N,N'-diacetylbacillosaminyl-diphospho-undecaprenol alpha-1,3-N-acetylgalactosaminyltransferase [Patiriisocius sp.]|jgi:N,N'-diacetylbacillosaminyl-diphospho-undecaprenol alpha-1,3-N-acetylgalactosaminyltransferase